MRFFFFLVTVFVINLEADAIEIECGFHSSWMSSHGYTCEVKSIILTSSDDRLLTSATGAHESGKTNDDVGFYYQHLATELKFFPQNITKFFRNVRDVYIRNTKITALGKEDLKPFGEQLERFAFDYNSLEAIDDDLFDYTLNLKYIGLTDIKAKFVAKGTFEKLNDLSTLYFNSNPCHSGSAYDRDAVIDLIATIESQCTDFRALERHRKLIQTTTEVTTTERNVAEELRNEIAKLNEEAAKSTAEIDNLKAENAKLLLEVEAKNHNEALNEQTKMEIIKKFNELEAKFDRSDDKIDTNDAKMEAKMNAIMKSVEECKDFTLQKFTTMNETCSALDYKLDLLNHDYISRPLNRQP